MQEKQKQAFFNQLKEKPLQNGNSDKGKQTPDTSRAVTYIVYHVTAQMSSKIFGGIAMFTARIIFSSGNVLELSIESSTKETAEKVVIDYLQKHGFNPWKNITILAFVEE